MSVPSLLRESTDSLILLVVSIFTVIHFSSDSERLQELLNFTVSCTLQLNGTKLAFECKVDGPTAVLPYNTTCQINDQPPETCELSIVFVGPIAYLVAGNIKVCYITVIMMPACSFAYQRIEMELLALLLHAIIPCLCLHAAALLHISVIFGITIPVPIYTSILSYIDMKS